MNAEWNTQPFESCIEDVIYTSKVQRKEFLDDGAYPVISQEEEFINGYWNNEADLFKVTSPVVLFGDHTKVLKYVDFDFVLGADGVKVLRPRDFLLPKFFFYQLQAVNLDSLGYARHYKLLKELCVRYPSKTEQQRIVRILDEALAGIATAKANAETSRENATALSKSFVHSVLAKPSRTWSAKTLDQLATNLDGKRVPVTKNARKAGKYPYYGASGIVDHVADYLFEGDTLLVSEDGANLLMRSTPIGFPASGRYWVNNHAHVLKFESAVTQRFVEHYLETIDLSQYITGAAQPKLTQKALNSIPIPIPLSIEEQRRVVTSIDELVAETTKLRELQRRKIDSLKTLKDTVLSEAFSGLL
jgi:type I restriction enzyme, S subunit